MQRLPREVGQLDHVTIDDRHPPDTRGCEIEDHRRAQRSRPDHEHSGELEPGLASFSPPVQDQLPAVALDLRVAEHRRSATHGLVEVAAPVAALVHGNARIAEAAEAALNPRQPPRLQQSRQIPRLDLDGGGGVGIPNAQLTEALGAQDALGRLDATTRLHRDRDAVRDARGEARRRRLVPIGKTQLTCEMADLLLAQTGIVQGTDHALFGGGAPAWSPIATIVAIEAIA